MNSELETQVYPEVERAVIWGHTREEVFALMASSGLSGVPAEALYRRARAERIGMIRAEAAARALKGAGIFLLSVLVFSGFWFGLGFIMRNIMIACGVAALFGLWWILDGLMNWALAPNKEGSLV